MSASTIAFTFKNGADTTHYLLEKNAKKNVTKPVCNHFILINLKIMDQYYIFQRLLPENKSNIKKNHPDKM